MSGRSMLRPYVPDFGSCGRLHAKREALRMSAKMGMDLDSL